MIGATTYDGLLPYLDDRTAAGTCVSTAEYVREYCRMHPTTCPSAAIDSIRQYSLTAFRAASHTHGRGRASVKHQWRMQR